MAGHYYQNHGLNVDVEEEMEAYPVTSPTAPAHAVTYAADIPAYPAVTSVVTDSVVTVQPGMYQSPADGLKTETWSSSLFGCSEDLNICCLGFWCPLCLACQTTSDFGEGLCMPMVDCACFPLQFLASPLLAFIRCGAVSAAALAMRSTLRERYNIQGSMCDDGATVTFCSPCAWCQMARELKRRRRPLYTTHTTTMYNMLSQEQTTVFKQLD